MGYYAFISDHSFRIPDLKAAAKLLTDSGDDLVEYLEHDRGYEDIYVNKDGTFDTIAFNSKYRSEDAIWRALAPLVQPPIGSNEPAYIEWQGEDHETWRFVFKDGEMHEVGCDIHWPYLNEPRTAPAVVEPLAITTMAGRAHLVDALGRELHETIRDPQRSKEIRMTIKSIEDAEKVVLNLEVIQ